MTEASQGRLLGAAIGASAAPAAMWGSDWSGLGASSVGAWLLTFAAGALLGGLTWRVFLGSREPNWVFCGLFGACAGLLAGALVGGPVGGVFGFSGGCAAGMSVTLVARPLRSSATFARGAAMLAAGCTSATLIGWGMTL